VGYVGWLGLFIGVDTLHAIEVMIDMINGQGGLKIGNEIYKINLISYDSNNDQATMSAAMNRLIFEDNVKFIVSDGFGIDGVFPITEANKVLLCSASQSPAILSPDNHMSFMVGFQNTGSSSIIGWFAHTYPDKKKMVFALPDSQMGHMGEMVNTPVLKAFNFDVDFEYYPANATDLSALGTKVKTVNPDVFACSMGSPIQPFAAVRQAGYTGQLFSPSAAISVNDMLTVLTPEQLEGFIGPATPTEFDPALTTLAQEFKDAWISKFGKWEGPEITMVANFNCLTAGLQKAGSLDPEAVAAVIGNGLEFETPSGPGKMISRPDLGNDRTIDSVATGYMKTVENSKAKLLYTISVDEALSYFKQVIGE